MTVKELYEVAYDCYFILVESLDVDSEIYFDEREKPWDKASAFYEAKVVCVATDVDLEGSILFYVQIDKEEREEIK